MNIEIIYTILLVLTMPLVTAVAVLINKRTDERTLEKNQYEMQAELQAKQQREIENLDKLVWKISCGLTDGGYPVDQVTKLFELTGQQKLLLAFRAREVNDVLPRFAG